MQRQETQHPRARKDHSDVSWPNELFTFRSLMRPCGWADVVLPSSTGDAFRHGKLCDVIEDSLKERCILVRVQTSSRTVSQCLSSFNRWSCFFEGVPRRLLSLEREAVAMPCVSISFGNVSHTLSNLIDCISIVKRCPLVGMLAFCLFCEACSTCCKTVLRHRSHRRLR